MGQFKDDVTNGVGLFSQADGTFTTLEINIDTESAKRFKKSHSSLI